MASAALGIVEPTLSTTLTPPNTTVDPLDISASDPASVSTDATGGLGSLGSIINSLGVLAADVGTVYTLSSQGKPSTGVIGASGVPGANPSILGMSSGSVALILGAAVLLVLVLVIVVKKR